MKAFLGAGYNAGGCKRDTSPRFRGLRYAEGMVRILRGQRKVEACPGKMRFQIPTQNNKIAAKLVACVLFVVILSLLLHFVNGYNSFPEAFGYGFLLWTIVNLWDMIVLDIIWFCHDPYFVFKGTEDMVEDYHDYWFHIKGFFIGETIALVVCALAGLVVQFVL